MVAKLWFVSEERDVGCDRYGMIEERSLKKGDEVK